MTTPMKNLDCCGPKTRKTTGKVKSGFVCWHPLKPGWEIRQCFHCGQQWAVDSKVLTA